MAILESLLPMRKSAGDLTFKRRKSDGRVIVSQKIVNFHNHRTTSSMRNKLTMLNTQSMYTYLKPLMRENIEADGSNRNAYTTYLHLNKSLTRCWLPQEERHIGNAILEPHYISNGTLLPVVCQLDGDNCLTTDIALSLMTLEGVTVGDFARDLLEHNADFEAHDLLRFVYLRQTRQTFSSMKHVAIRIEDDSRLLILAETDERMLSEVVDTALWGVRDGYLATLQPLSYAAATVVRLRPQVAESGYGQAMLHKTLAMHLAAGLPLATYLKPDAKPLAFKVSRQQLVCVNPLIEEYSSEERFLAAARTFGPIRDDNADSLLVQ